MAISDEVKRQFFAHNGETNQVIRLPLADIASRIGPNRRVGRPWTKEEHERFLEGLQMFPDGPWRRIATHVGTRTSRQTMTHAQKYRERISRLLVSPISIQSSASPSPRRSPSKTPASEGPEDMNTHQPYLFDDLDLEILSCLLGGSGVASEDSSPSCESLDDFFGDLLGEARDDHDMLRLLAKLDVGDHHAMSL